MISLKSLVKMYLPVLGILAIIGIGISPSTVRAQANGGIPDYKINWQAESYMTISFPATLWPRDMLALGPASWRVNYQTKQANCSNENSPSCYKQIAHENWSIANPATDDCFGNYNRTNCNGSTMDRAKWLWATGGCVFQNGWSFLSACGTTGVNAWDPNFEIKPLDEPELYQNNAARGDGPGLLWETNGSGTTAFWAQGAYGYAEGGIDQTTNRAGINVIGTMIPLRWHVEGYND